MPEPLQSQKRLKTIKDAYSHTVALANIAVAQAKAGDVKGALATTQTIAYTSYLTLTLARIAWAQAEAGDLKEAKKTFAKALATSKTIKGVYERNSVLAAIAKVLAVMK